MLLEYAYAPIVTHEKLTSKYINRATWRRVWLDEQQRNVTGSNMNVISKTETTNAGMENC